MGAGEQQGALGRPVPRQLRQRPRPRGSWQAFMGFAAPNLSLRPEVGSAFQDVAAGARDAPAAIPSCGHLQ